MKLEITKAYVSLIQSIKIENFHFFSLEEFTIFSIPIAHNNASYCTVQQKILFSKIITNMIQYNYHWLLFRVDAISISLKSVVIILFLSECTQSQKSEWPQITRGCISNVIKMLPCYFISCFRWNSLTVSFGALDGLHV